MNYSTRYEPIDSKIIASLSRLFFIIILFSPEYKYTSVDSYSVHQHKHKSGINSVYEETKIGRKFIGRNN
jgi:hypothetical protein